MHYVSSSVEQTYEIAKRLAANLIGGEIILLDGNLGAGKTTFTQGLAKALEIKEQVVSPTFMLMCQYEGRLKLYHFDLYRIEDADETDELGFDEYLGNSDAVCVVEWNKFILPQDLKVITVALERIDDTTRSITII